jgi:SAM-dependent methyltransferase
VTEITGGAAEAAPGYVARAEVRVSEAPVPLESPSCLLCGGTDFTPVLTGVEDRVWHKPGRFTIARCAGCAFVMTRPRPTPEGLGFYYAEAYSGGAGAIDMRAFYTSWVGRLVNRYRLVTIEKVRKPSADDHILDVGCSQGFFLQAAREAVGCRTSGIDLDAGSIALAVDPAACAYHTGRLVDCTLPEGAFTVVTFFECLEHETDPVGALRAARRVLAPGGLCVVEVPNFGSPWRRVFGRSWMPLLIPQHLSHFTQPTLRAALERAGFEVVHQQTMLFPIEMTASTGIWLGRLLGLRPVPAADRGAGRKLLDAAIGLLLTVLFWTVEVPTQFWLRVFGLAGHQTIIGRRPAAG